MKGGARAAWSPTGIKKRARVGKMATSLRVHGPYSVDRAVRSWRVVLLACRSS